MGESDKQILGRSRASMVWLPWIAMMAISVFEFGFGAASKTLMARYGWGLSDTFWLASVWAVFQAGVAFPAGRLREKNIIRARTAMLLGAVLSGAGYIMLAHSGNIVVAIFGYSALGGIGSGLVYATCVNMVGKWYPERRGGKTGFVNGGFAYGAVPFIYLFSYGFTPGNYQLVLDAVGVYMLVVVGICGLFFKDPPPNWWPRHIDPLAWAANAKSARSLAKNPPAVRQYTPAEAIRTGMLPLMWVCLVIIGGVSLFGINFQVPFAKASHFGPFVAASSMGIMSVINGTGRGVVGWASDRLGRRQTLCLVLAIAGVAQFGVLWSGLTHSLPFFLVFAFVNGFSGGAFYPLFASLVPDYFGENNNAQNYGLVYSAKLVGGVGGVGLASLLVEAWGYTGTYILAGLVAFLSAALVLLLRQPGHARAMTVTLTEAVVARRATTEAAAEAR
ncbi:MAG TPA: OFA family MFS transporter [Rugosimonospora sp.]|nr:OFA family MFS transporter [Rugosimonospora sp.]